MSITCSEVRSELPLHVGGDLESPGRERVESHLGSCAPCRAALEQARNARAVLRGHFERVDQRSEAPSIWPDLRQRLGEEGLLNLGVETSLDSESRGLPRPSAAGSPATLGRGRLLRFASFAAAAAALFFLGTFAGRLVSNETPGNGAEGGLGGPAPPVVVTNVGNPNQVQPVSGLRLVSGSSMEDEACDYPVERPILRSPYLPGANPASNSSRTASYRRSGVR